MPLGNNRHITFDEDEDFENPPAFEALSKDSDEEAEEEEEEDIEDSDSDAPPEEATISAGKEDAQKTVHSLKSEVEKHRKHVKEKRKQQHEKNKLQQEEKRKRLEEKRLPQSLLDAFAEEQKTRPPQHKQVVPIKRKRKKIKTFSDDDGDDDEGTVENVDEDGLITLERGVKVRTVNEEAKKYNDIGKRAADFRTSVLYGRNIKRIPTSDLHAMKVKQMKSGKAVFANGNTKT